MSIGVMSAGWGYLAVVLVLGSGGAALALNLIVKGLHSKKD